MNGRNEYGRTQRTEDMIDAIAYCVNQIACWAAGTYAVIWALRWLGVLT